MCCLINKNTWFKRNDFPLFQLTLILNVLTYWNEWHTERPWTSSITTCTFSLRFNTTNSVCNPLRHYRAQVTSTTDWIEQCTTVWKNVRKLNVTWKCRGRGRHRCVSSRYVPIRKQRHGNYRVPRLSFSTKHYLKMSTRIPNVRVQSSLKRWGPLAHFEECLSN